MKHTLAAFIFSFLLLLVTTAQAQNNIFKRYAPPEGIGMGISTGITQDAKGYMWFAGTGLYRYDGYHLTTYLNDPLDINSLGSNQLESLCSTKEGILWIGTQGSGLDRFDPVTGIFTHYRHIPTDSSSIIHNKVTALLVDHEGILWIGTHGGLDRFDPKTNKFYHFRKIANDPASLSCDQVRSIYEDRQGTIWVGTGSAFPNDDSGPDDGGLNRLDRKTGRFTRYMHDPKDPHSLINNKVCGMLEDSRGIFWVGSAGDGLHIMDRSKGTFERHRYDPAQPDKLSRPPISSPSPTNYDHIRFIAEDAAGYIWIGTVLAGMNRYDPITQNVTHFDFGKNSVGLTDNTSWNMFTSREGVLWVSTWHGDIYYTDPLQNKIPQTNINAVAQDILEEDSNTIWIGTNDGVIRTDRKTNTSKQFENTGLDSTSLSNNFVISIHKDHQGDIWVGTRFGLNRFNKNTQDFTRFLHDDKRPGGLKDVGVFEIAEDKNGSFWLATDLGVVQLDREKNVVAHYRNNPEDTGSLSTPWTVAIHEDLSGNLWIGNIKGGGINLLNRKTGKFRHYLLGLDIGCFFEDTDRVLWAGTDGGLFRYDSARDVFSLFADPKKNIKSENIIVFAIVEDNRKNLWMASSAGILKLNASRNELNSYGKNYGVNANFLTPSACKGFDGKIYIVDATGYFSFFPDSISGNSKPPQIVFGDFRVGDKSVRPGTNSPVKEEIDVAKEIILKYDENIFSFDFAGIHFSSPEENKHLFMLENYDKGWRQSGTEHTAYYYNVPPGHYVFRVKATNSNGMSAEKSIAVIINPPWWFTWWAYLIYAILFVALVYSMHRFQKQRVINAERERTRAREQAQAKEIEKAYHELKTMQSQLIEQEKMASLGELTAGIAHEIQNPLNFVNNFSEVNAELIHELYEEIKKGNLEQVGAIAASLKENEEKIAHHGKRADGIVKGMLQHSRASTGQKEPSDINSLADEYLRLSYHGMRAKDKMFNAEIETDYDPEIAQINIIPQEIGRVLLNLYNNAFFAIMEKKTNSNGDYKPKISVHTRRTNGKVEIGVKDNGKGIPENIKGKIFQPFFTTKPAGQGTGLGLSLSYDIIKAHGGTLKVESKEGEGTAFVVQLPV